MSQQGGSRTRDRGFTYRFQQFPNDFFRQTRYHSTIVYRKGEKYGNFQTVRGISNGAGRRVADLATVQGEGAAGGSYQDQSASWDQGDYISGGEGAHSRSWLLEIYRGQRRLFSYAAETTGDLL